MPNDTRLKLSHKTNKNDELSESARIRRERKESMADIQELLERINNDPELAGKIKAAGSVDEVVRIAEEAGIALSKEAIEKMVAVSDEDIENAAGGVSVIITRQHGSFDARL